MIIWCTLLAVVIRAVAWFNPLNTQLECHRARGSTKAKAYLKSKDMSSTSPQVGNSLLRRIGLGLRAKPGSLDDEQPEIIHEDIITKPSTSRPKKSSEQKALDYFSLKALNIKKEDSSKETPDL